MYEVVVVFLALEVFVYAGGLAILFRLTAESSRVYSSCFVKCLGFFKKYFFMKRWKYDGAEGVQTLELLCLLRQSEWVQLFLTKSADLQTLDKRDVE